MPSSQPERGLFAEGAAPLDLIDDLPTRDPRPLKEALALVDAGKRERQELRAEVARLREENRTLRARLPEDPDGLYRGTLPEWD